MAVEQITSDLNATLKNLLNALDTQTTALNYLAKINLNLLNAMENLAANLELSGDFSGDNDARLPKFDLSGRRLEFV